MGINVRRNNFLERQKNSYNRIFQTSFFDTIIAVICSSFFILLFAGHYLKNYQLLSALNISKFLIIPLFSLCMYNYYRTRSKVVFFVLLSALLLTWFLGFNFAYHWDSIEHVVRAKYYLTHSYFFSTEERHSFLYLIWGGFYKLFGETESLTHLINMFLGICGIFGIYAISKELYEDLTAFIALIVSLTFPAFFLVNKWAYLDMPFTTFVITTFYFLFKYINTKSDKFLYLSFIFAFISFGTKDPGLVLFPAIFLCLFIYHHLNRKILISILSIFLFSILYFFKVMYYSKIMSEFSIVSPLTFGTDVIMIWMGFLRQEISQYIYSGIFFLSVFAFVKTEEKNKFLLYSLLVIQILLLIVCEIYPSKLGYWSLLIPSGNYLPYYILLGLSILCLLISMKLYKTRLEISRKEMAMLIWIASFSAFFIINGRIEGYGLKPLIDVSILDFRYLMPAFPALIILFSSSIAKILRSNYSEKVKFIVIFILALTLIFNFITATNWTFYCANAGNARLEGYEEISKQNPDIIYTHWPFYYAYYNEQNPDIEPTDGSFYYAYNYDIGGFTWKKDKISVSDINFPTQSLNSSSTDRNENKAYILFDTYFHSPEELMNINSKKIEAKTYLLDPFFISITEQIVNSVYTAKLESGSIIMKEGFYQVEDLGNKRFRWMTDNSTLYVYSDADSNTMFNMRVKSFRHARTLQMHINGNLASSKVIPTDFVNVKVPVSLKKGMNLIQLTVPEGSEKPADFPELKNNDTRDLSIVIQYA